MIALAVGFLVPEEYAARFLILAAAVITIAFLVIDPITPRHKQQRSG